MDNESTWQWWRPKVGRQTSESDRTKITALLSGNHRCLDFTSLSLLIMSGIQSNNLIVIKPLRADNSSAANKEVIWEI